MLIIINRKFKQWVSLLLCTVTIISNIVLPVKKVSAHDVDGIYYVPSVVQDHKTDYRDISLFYKQPWVESPDYTMPISKPTSAMQVSSNGQIVSDGGAINSVVGKPISIDFSQSTYNGMPMVSGDIGLQITNGTGKLMDWSSLPNGSQSASAYSSQYPFSWGAATFTPTQPGTYTIYGEVRADIDKSLVFEHWDVWSENGSQSTPDSVTAHNSAASGYDDGSSTYNGYGWVKNYPVTWHFEKVVVNVAPLGTLTVRYKDKATGLEIASSILINNIPMNTTLMEDPPVINGYQSTGITYIQWYGDEGLANSQTPQLYNTPVNSTITETNQNGFIYFFYNSIPPTAGRVNIYQIDSSTDKLLGNNVVDNITLPGSYTVKADDLTAPANSTYDGSKLSYTATVPTTSSRDISATSQTANLTDSQKEAWIYLYYKISGTEPTPSPPPTPSPTYKPPIAVIVSADSVVAGEYIGIGSGSYDTNPGGKIVQNIWSVPGSSGTMNDGGGAVKYNTVGDYTVSLISINNYGLAGTANKIIHVTPPIPTAVIDVSGTLKENRKFNISSANSRTPSSFPIDVTKTTWTVTPVTGGTATDIKNIGSLSGSISNDMLIKKAGTYKITLSVTNTAGYTDTEEKTITISPDIAPVSNFIIPSDAYRNLLDSNYASFNISDMSYSTDSDYISSRIYEYCYDANNDGIFNEAWVIFNSGNNLNATFKGNQVGKYKIRETVKEGFGQDSILEFIINSDYKTAVYERIIEVKNTAPIVSFSMVKRKPVDVAVLTDYTGQKLADLTSSLSTFKSDLYSKGVDVNFNIVDGNQSYNITNTLQRRIIKTDKYTDQYAFRFDDTVAKLQDITKYRIIVGSIYDPGLGDYVDQYSYLPSMDIYDTPTTISGGLRDVIQHYRVLDSRAEYKTKRELALDYYGKVWERYRDSTGWYRVPELSNIVQIYSTGYFAAFLTADNRVYVWGNEYYGFFLPLEYNYNGYVSKNISRPTEVANPDSPAYATATCQHGETQKLLIGKDDLGFRVEWADTGNGHYTDTYYNSQYGIISYFPFFCRQNAIDGPPPDNREYYWLAEDRKSEIRTVNTNAVKNTTLRDGSERYFLYVSDGEGSNYNAGFGNYYSAGNLNTDFSRYLTDNKFNVNIVSPSSTYDYTATYSDQITTLRSLIASSPSGGNLYEKGLVQQALTEIKNKLSVPSEGVSQYVLINENFNIQSSYSDYENDSKHSERFRFDHNPYYFTNSMGTEANSGVWTSTGPYVFTKPGEYKINYQARDNPKNDVNFDSYRLWSNLAALTIYAHRRPVADFDIGLSKNVGVTDILEDYSSTAKIPLTSKDGWFVDTYRKALTFDHYFNENYSRNPTATYTFNVSGTGQLSFDYTISYPNSTQIIIYLDGNMIDRWTGVYNREATKSYSVQLSPGTHTLKFEGYEGSPSAYSGAVLIDNLHFTDDNSTYTGSVADNSYDLDSIYAANRGIANWRWNYRELGAASWIGGLPAEYAQKKYYEVSLEVQDLMGVWSEPKIKIVDTWNTAPTIDANPASYGWTNQNIPVTVTANDNGENDFSRFTLTTTSTTVEPVWIDSTWYQKIVPITYTQEGIWYLHMRVFDNADNTFYRYRGPYLIDKTPPGGTAAPYSTGWTNQDVTVTFSPWDNLSGVSSWRYIASSNNGASWGAWSGYSWGAAPSAVTFNYDGIHKLLAEVTDNAGNVSYVSTGNYLIDKTAPVITPDKNGPLDVIDSVTVNLTVSDNLSGVKETKYMFSQSMDRPSNGWITTTAANFPASINQEGTWFLHVESTDNAGNVSYSIIGSFKVNTVRIYDLTVTLINDITWRDYYYEGSTYNQGGNPTQFSRKSNTDIIASQMPVNNYNSAKIIAFDRDGIDSGCEVNFYLRSYGNPENVAVIAHYTTETGEKSVRIQPKSGINELWEYTFVIPSECKQGTYISFDVEAVKNGNVYGTDRWVEPWLPLNTDRKIFYISGNVLDRLKFNQSH